MLNLRHLGKWIQSGCFLLRKEQLCIISYRECLRLWWTITGGILKLPLTWLRDLWHDIYLWWVQRLYHQLLGDKHVGVAPHSWLLSHNVYGWNRDWGRDSLCMKMSYWLIWETWLHFLYAMKAQMTDQYGNWTFHMLNQTSFINQKQCTKLFRKFRWQILTKI